jgi:FkbM family methyltransferase
MATPFLHPQNWRSATRIFSVFASPLAFLAAAITGRAPASIVVRTPAGPQRIELRNSESLRTVFAIFCREDYATAAAPAIHVVDIGANIGVASLYFLTRNPGNTVVAYEPDRANLDCLRRNLAPFGARARLVPQAVGPVSGVATLYRSEDGKYSSLIRGRRAKAAHSRANMPETVELAALCDILAEAVAGGREVVAKIDVEMLEKQLLASVDFADYPALKRLVVEGRDISSIVARPHRATRRGGAIDDLVFIAP